VENILGTFSASPGLFNIPFFNGTCEFSIFKCFFCFFVRISFATPRKNLQGTLFVSRDR
jgi:hypothetical protein